MNAEDPLLLDEALGLLDDSRRGALEREVAADPCLAERRARLRHAVTRLLNDGRTTEPPEDLAARTIAAVEARRQRRRRTGFGTITVPFRWADVAVAAGIFLAGVLTLLPALHRDRARMAQLSCMANLQQVGYGLFRYASIHNSYPYIPPGSPGSYVGAYAVQLHDEGLIPDGTALHCPCSYESHPSASLMGFKDLCEAERRSPGVCRSAITGDYAYHLGYKDGDGHPGPIIPDGLTSCIPLLADQPPHDPDGRILAGNSPNHAGIGQNVLFSDLHVGWKRNRWISPSDRDLFLNNESRPAPGVDCRDSVLVPPLFRFGGL